MIIYDWKVETADDKDLAEKLNAVEGWEVFAVIPTLLFDRKVMGTVIPSGVQHNIVLRKPREYE
tara:strand:+ start:187 stop:378 length:192 start_codon:yes stop_codon:yes gene_type:complete